MSRRIRVNYLFEQCEGDWSKRYNEAVLEALSEFELVEALNVTYCDEAIIKEMVDAAPWCDVWFVFSIFDKWVKPVWERSISRDEKMIIHNHGGVETGDYEALLYGSQDTTQLPEIAREPNVKVLFNSYSNREEFLHKYDAVNGNVVGFPVHVPVERREYKAYSGIVVPGRLSVGKQPLLAAKILAPYRSRTTFCTGELEGKNEDMAKVLRALGFKVVRVRDEDYFNLVNSRRVGFTASLADSLNASCVEMAALGLRVVAPNLPQFGYLPHLWKYEPYSIASARERVRSALNDSWEPLDVSQFSKAKFSANVRALIKEWVDLP